MPPGRRARPLCPWRPGGEPAGVQEARIRSARSRAPIKLRMHRSATEIVTEISDDSPRLPQRRLAGPGDESGRGLILVEALATQWGTRPAPAGKTFWFTIALNQAQALRPQATAH